MCSFGSSPLSLALTLLVPFLVLVAVVAHELLVAGPADV